MEERAFWYIPERLTTALPIKECGEPLIDVLQQLPDTEWPYYFRPAPAVNGANECRFLLRQDVARRFGDAARAVISLSNGKIMLKVTDSFRPLSLQRAHFEKIKKNIARKESLAGDALWERVTQFIADPDLCPPHTTGGAIDLTLVRSKNGTELPMGTPVDAIDDRAFTWHREIAAAAQKNRRLLFDAMTGAGFVNLASEWWHFSYGDQYWAAFLGEHSARYDSLDRAD